MWVAPPPSALAVTGPTRWSAALRRPAVLATAAVGLVALGVVGALTGRHVVDGQPAGRAVLRPAASTPSSRFATFAALFHSTSGAVVRLTSDECDAKAVGTGFFIDAHHIATVAHVIAGASSIEARAGDRVVPVRVVGQDLAQDVALLYTPRAWSGPVIPLATAPPDVGDSVAALGFPKGLPLSFSRGSVSAVDQTLEDGAVAQHGLVQTDTPLNHGNSGGPLLTLDGTAVGLVDSARIDANNISYAVGAAVAATDFAGWPDSRSVPPTSCDVYDGTPYAPDPPPDAGAAVSSASAPGVTASRPTAASASVPADTAGRNDPAVGADAAWPDGTGSDDVGAPAADAADPSLGPGTSDAATDAEPSDPEPTSGADEDPPAPSSPEAGADATG